MVFKIIPLDRERECLIVEADDSSKSAGHIRAVRSEDEDRTKALARAIWPDTEVTVKTLDSLALIRVGGTVHEWPAVVLAWRGADPFSGRYEEAQQM